MIVYIGNDTIKTLTNGHYRAHRLSNFWIGDYANFADAKRALQIANSRGATNYQRGVYDGGFFAEEATHIKAVETIFGVENRVTDDDVRRTILPGEPCIMLGGLIPIKISPAAKALG